MCAPEPSISTKLCLFSLLRLQAKPSWGRAAPGCPPQHVPICPAMPPLCHLCPSYLFIYLSLWISFCLDSCSLDALRGLRSGLGWFWGPGDGVGWPRGVPATCGSLPVQGHGDTACATTGSQQGVTARSQSNQRPPPEIRHEIRGKISL